MEYRYAHLVLEVTLVGALATSVHGAQVEEAWQRLGRQRALANHRHAQIQEFADRLNEVLLDAI